MWILSFTFDAVACNSELTLTQSPEMPIPHQVVCFEAVDHVSIQRYHAPDEPSLGEFKGVSETPVGEGRSRFSVNTGDALVAFEARSTGPHPG